MQAALAAAVAQAFPLGPVHLCEGLGPPEGLFLHRHSRIPQQKQNAAHSGAARRRRKKIG